MSEKALKGVVALLMAAMVWLSGCSGIQMRQSNLVYEAKNKISEGDLRTSIPILNKALALDPNDLEANVAMAEVQYRLGNFHDALRYAKKAHLVRPRDFRALGILGLIDLEEGAYERGMNRVYEAVKIYEGIEEVGGNLPVEPEIIIKEMRSELKQNGKVSHEKVNALADAFWAKVDWYEFDEEYRKWHFRSFYDVRPDGGAPIP